MEPWRGDTVSCYQPEFWRPLRGLDTQTTTSQGLRPGLHSDAPVGLEQIQLSRFIVAIIACNDCNDAMNCNYLQRNAMHCNDVQRIAMHCNDLQCNATKCNEMRCIARGERAMTATMQRPPCVLAG